MRQRLQLAGGIVVLLMVPVLLAYTWYVFFVRR
jgi:hypothetical protein